MSILPAHFYYPSTAFDYVYATWMLLGVPLLGGLQSEHSGENGNFQALYENISQTESNTAMVTINHQWEITYG